MVFETIIIGFVCIVVAIILAFGGIIGVGTYKSISLGLAEIGEAGKNTRERINVRADLAYDDSDNMAESDGDSASELDGIARLMNYDSFSSAIADPALVGKVMSMFNRGKE